MKRYFLQAGCLAAVALLVQGCAPLAPGFSSASNDAAKAVSPSGFSTNEIDPPPPGAITEITPELIQAQRAATAKSTVGSEVRKLIGEAGPYRIGPGDVLGIQVLDHPEIIYSTPPSAGGGDGAAVTAAPGYIVSVTGQMSFPYAGSLNVNGMTVEEVEQALVKRLSRVYRDPQLSVRVNAFRSKRAYMEGEIRTPGLMVFSDIPMTLAEAMNRAGGLTTNGDRSAIELTRDGKMTPLNLLAMADAGIDPSRILLKPGDMLYFRSRDETKVGVLGEVTSQLGVPMRNGRLSLSDALIEAGGLNLNTANPIQIYVIRNEPTGGQSIFHLDAKTPTALAMADGFALRAKDVVFVDPVPLVKWNRVLNLVLPTATTWTTYRGVVTPTGSGR
ncbi:polysaccharide biosynthesis/export family protein [Variovorax sp. Sphag1AA]|uniref:polysaccharide biosynthesis/export family protein n=1 Tax=Variovorax sp. Sphag1AA TaxID=2587027 RepID=UPI00161C5EFC|nr:polysaccharide biosynthesis/export family protein [Variovorax sp. Sphag1AA]MBB3179456.1 polysaccharide export outer membrane protein [Variovorax sp. Sphag1AA]